MSRPQPNTATVRPPTSRAASWALLSMPNAMPLHRQEAYLEMVRSLAKDVAAETGIETVSHFIKLFRAHEGITPAEYRRVWKTRRD